MDEREWMALWEKQREHNEAVNETIGQLIESVKALTAAVNALNYMAHERDDDRSFFTNIRRTLAGLRS